MSFIDDELNRRGVQQPKKVFVLPTKSDGKFTDINTFYGTVVSQKAKELRSVAREESIAKQQAKRLAMQKKKESAQRDARFKSSVGSLFGRSELFR